MLRKENLNKVYLLFAQCIPVKGFCRSMIVDTMRHRCYPVPNSLFHILTRYGNKTLQNVMANFKEGELSVISEYFDYLDELKIIFPIEEFEIKRFPKLSLHWDFPSLISNSIVDIRDANKYNIHNAMEKLSDANCFHLQIRIYEKILGSEFEKLMNQIHDLSFRSLQLVLNWDPNKREDDYVDMMKNYWKVSKIEIYDSPCDKIIPVFGTFCQIICYKKKIDNSLQCGKIVPEFFSVNIDHFTEAQHFNTCLNRKLCVDEDGAVKHCPSMSRSFGHIDDVDLKELVSSPDFTGIWSVRKDDIDVCKDCEFRYICTDCRCFIKDFGNIYSQPAKCAYNPYIAKWEGEDGYIAVENGGKKIRCGKKE